MAHAWHFLGSTTLQRLGKRTLREDAWRLPTGALRRYPVLAMAIDDRITESVSKVPLLAAALKRGLRP